jgi:hypothetical protein
MKERDVSANGNAVSEVMSPEGLIDDGYTGMEFVLAIEVAPGKKGRFNCLEVVRGNKTNWICA